MKSLHFIGELLHLSNWLTYPEVLVACCFLVAQSKDCGVLHLSTRILFQFSGVLHLATQILFQFSRVLHLTTRIYFQFSELLHL